LGARDLLPGLKSLLPSGAVIGGRHLVTARPEDVVDGRMDCEKVLRLTGGLEAAHLAFLLAGRLMGDFRLIVQALVLAVLDAGQDLFTSRPVTA
jgi:hypothetical protein